MKSSVERIRQRFDADVGRFANLETGQSATVDAPLALELIVRAAAATNPAATTVLDVGCGAGNYSLKLLQALPGLGVTLIDLSAPMLERAVERVRAADSGEVTALQGDIRELSLGTARFDIILAGAVLHHLREEDEWREVFAKLYRALKPSGSLWISDLIAHAAPQVQRLMWQRYGDYLTALGGEAYRDHVFTYIEEEDSPRPLLFQIRLLQEVGFNEVEILHKNSLFAAFGAIKVAD